MLNGVLDADPLWQLACVRVVSTPTPSVFGKFDCADAGSNQSIGKLLRIFSMSILSNWLVDSLASLGSTFRIVYSKLVGVVKTNSLAGSGLCLD